MTEKEFIRWVLEVATQEYEGDIRELKNTAKAERIRL